MYTLPALQLAAPGEGFFLITSHVWMLEGCGCCTAEWRHNLELTSKDASVYREGTGTCKACGWGTGTAPGPTWDKTGDMMVRPAVLQSTTSLWLHHCCL